MPFKIVIAESTGKSWKLELADETLAGKSLGDKANGKELKPELEGYEFEITGGSDNAGFPLSKNVEGIGLKRVLFTHGFAMRDNYPGIRRRKTVRGKQISTTTAQLNMKILKAGAKPLVEIFPEQNKPKEKKKEVTPKAAETTEKKAEAAPAETKPVEQKAEAAQVQPTQAAEKPAEQKAEAAAAQPVQAAAA